MCKEKNMFAITKKWTLLAALMLLSLSASAWNYRNFGVKAVTGFDKNGKALTQNVSLSDYVGKGKYVLIDFWASWCGPCRAEVPNLQAIYKQYGGKDFEIVSVAVWDSPMDSWQAIKEEGMTWTQIVCTEQDSQVPTRVYGISGIPYIILVAPDGKVIGERLRGYKIEEAVRKALGK